SYRHRFPSVSSPVSHVDLSRNSCCDERSTTLMEKPDLLFEDGNQFLSQRRSFSQPGYDSTLNVERRSPDPQPTDDVLADISLSPANTLSDDVVPIGQEPIERILRIHRPTRLEYATCLVHCCRERQQASFADRRSIHSNHE